MVQPQGQLLSQVYSSAKSTIMLFLDDLDSDNDRNCDFRNTCRLSVHVEEKDETNETYQNKTGRWRSTDSEFHEKPEW